MSEREQLSLALDEARREGRRELEAGAVVLHGFALADEAQILGDLATLVSRTTLRHMSTPGGRSMSVAMTNCGRLGWVSDAAGYRYTAIDPLTDRAWPEMPASFDGLARAAAMEAGYPGFVPDACLVNRYAPGSRLTMHRDENERDLDAPIVSVSLGVSAVFLFGGRTREARPLSVRLLHGDVAVWGGPSRLNYHGVLPVEEGQRSPLGAHRVNLTFRRAG